MALKLVVQRAGNEGDPGPAAEEIVLDQDTVSIGRDPVSDVPLDEKLVSRRHARIWREGPAYFLQDLRSTQGTFLNDHKLTPGDAEPLRNGDVVKLPGFTITFITWNASHVPSGRPDGTASVAKSVLKKALKSMDEAEPVLRVLNTGDRLDLAPGAEITIGRDPDACDLVLDAEKVSRKHAKVRRDWGGVTLFDLGSTNGVRVNGKRVVNEHKLRDRDEVEIGGVRILYIDPTEVREERLSSVLPPDVKAAVAALATGTPDEGAGGIPEHLEKPTTMLDREDQSSAAAALGAGDPPTADVSEPASGSAPVDPDKPTNPQPVVPPPDAVAAAAAAIDGAPSQDMATSKISVEDGQVRAAVQALGSPSIEGQAASDGALQAQGDDGAADAPLKNWVLGAMVVVGLALGILLVAALSG